jgi:hypothetical protein
VHQLCNQQLKHFIMAVKPEIIKARLKVLFPKANLSQKKVRRLRLNLHKTTDDADDATIDAIINDYNEVIDFEAVAKGTTKHELLRLKKESRELAAKRVGKKEEEERS